MQQHQKRQARQQLLQWTGAFPATFVHLSLLGCSRSPQQIRQCRCVVMLMQIGACVEDCRASAASACGSMRFITAPGCAATSRLVMDSVLLRQALLMSVPKVMAPRTPRAMNPDQVLDHSPRGTPVKVPVREVGMYYTSVNYMIGRNLLVSQLDVMPPLPHASSFDPSRHSLHTRAGELRLAAGLAPFAGRAPREPLLAG